MSRGYRLGPRSKASFGDAPDNDSANASKTGLTFVVVEALFKTP